MRSNGMRAAWLASTFGPGISLLGRLTTAGVLLFGGYNGTVSTPPGPTVTTQGITFSKNQPGGTPAPDGRRA